MSEYPEHDKMAAIADDSQVIGQFLEGGGYVLAQWSTFDEGEDPHLMPVSRPIEQVLAHYFGIDLAKVEAEKREMLDQIRRAQA